MKNWIMLMSLAVLPASALAADEIDPLLWGCSEIKDNDKRLACFDAYVRQKTQQQSKSVKQPGPLVLNSNGDQAQQTNAVVPKKPVEPQQPEVTAAPNPEVQQQFGLEHKKTEEEKQVSEILSSITKASKQAHNKWVFTLANGQKWRTVEATSTSYKSGQDVVISRGMFNSFSLKKTDSNRTVKVKRVK
ncbi:hypothetical protein [Thalassotalea sp. PS06]|uniref:hypothetical protein n=1 Tax=Thalassotalea sp. PS06 TaxID=2594005 RepID=UPI0011632760|nr:hypothetical protein [Thalassotalea sp. PS06]QDP02721.1 hypothetical protein FNC98_16050 [Thalassotalea sp. PS06]